MKCDIKKFFASGVDFFGWVHFRGHRVLRTSTKRRMAKRTFGLEAANQTAESYRGMLRHGNAEKLKRKMRIDVGDSLV